jgi:hypothetical protein
VQFLQEIAPRAKTNNASSFKEKKKKEENVFSCFNFHSKESFSRKSHKKEEETKEEYLPKKIMFAHYDF